MEKYNRSCFIKKGTKFVLDKTSEFPFMGFSVQWDEYLNTRNCKGEHVDKKFWAEPKDFDFVCERAKDLELKKLRFYFRNGLILTTKDGGYNFDNEKIKDDIKLLTFAKENNIEVCLVFTDTVTFSDDGTLYVNMADNNEYYTQNINNKYRCDIDLFINSIKATMQYLYLDKGFTCIKEITVFNEPDVDTDRYKYTKEDYKNACYGADKALKELGIRDKIKLNLSDNLCQAGQKDFIKLLGDFSDVYNNHIYLNSKEDSNEFLTFISRMGAKASKKLNKPFLINDFGWDNGLSIWGPGTISTWGQEEVDTFDRAFFIIRFIIQSINIGVNGMSYKSLYDTYYQPQKDKKWTAGLFKYKDEGFLCRPQYYAYSLFTKYTDIGGKTYLLLNKSEDVIGTAFKNKDGSFTYYVCNTSDKEQRFTFINKFAKNLKFKRYVFNENNIPKNGETVKSDKNIKAFGSILTETIPAKTLYCYSTR